LCLYLYTCSEASVVNSSDICLESVADDDDEGVRKVLHMGDAGDMLAAAGHIVVEDSMMMHSGLEGDSVAMENYADISEPQILPNEQKDR